MKLSQRISFLWLLGSQTRGIARKQQISPLLDLFLLGLFRWKIRSLSRRERGRKKQETRKGVQSAREHQKGVGAYDVDTLSLRRPAARKKEPENKSIEDQLLQLVGSIEDLVTDGFFGVVFDFHWTDDPVDPLSRALVRRKTFLVDLGKTNPLLNSPLFIGFLEGERNPQLGLLRKKLVERKTKSYVGVSPLLYCFNQRKKLLVIFVFPQNRMPPLKPPVERNFHRRISDPSQSNQFHSIYVHHGMKGK